MPASHALSLTISERTRGTGTEELPKALPFSGKTRMTQTGENETERQKGNREKQKTIVDRTTLTKRKIRT